MAKIVEEHIVIKVSYLVKDSDTTSVAVSSDQRATIESVVGEVLGDIGAVVEVLNE
jgi:hypothetical protein